MNRSGATWTARGHVPASEREPHPERTLAAGLRAVARACRVLNGEAQGGRPLEQALAEILEGTALGHAALYQAGWGEPTLRARCGSARADWLPRQWNGTTPLPAAGGTVVAIELPSEGGPEGVLVICGEAPVASGLRQALVEGAPALGAALARRRELEDLRRRCPDDPLTRALNPHAFRERLEEEVDRARRYGVALGLVLADVDHMAALNQRLGRDAGDAALVELAGLLRGMKRRFDALGRTRGDELAWLLPEADAAATVRCADRLRRAVAAHSFPRALRISVSAGVASMPREAMGASELRAAAERSLTLAKKSGRNRVGPTTPTAIH